MHFMSDDNDSIHQNPGFEHLIGLLPEKARDFEGTEYPQPAAMAYFGERADVDRLRDKAEERKHRSPAALCELAMVMAEVIESDSEPNCFITDTKLRGLIFQGAKWRAGLALVLGSADHSELVRLLKEREFLVFAQGDYEGSSDLGPRETASVYFLQIMVRYAMIWGGIQPGDDHEMGHFLEVDFPGVVMAEGSLTPTEELLLLALMKMGAPAVVSHDYPYTQGRQVRAETAGEIIEAACKFPNLRVKEVEGETLSLPDYCDPSHASEPFQAARTIGAGNSFFALVPESKGEGVSVDRDRPVSECTEIGILISAGHEHMDLSASKYLEDCALKYLGYLKGLRGERDDEGGFHMQLAEGDTPALSQVAETLLAGVKCGFPLLQDIHVAIITDPDELKRRKPEIDDFNQTREKAIAEESDDNVPYFHYCIECQPFAQSHVCIVTPDRPTMCGRHRLQVKCAALFGASWHPYKRRAIENEDLRGSIPVETPIDGVRGEYEKVNRAAKQLTGGKIERVFLHSLRDHPHSSCGCFQFLAFLLPDGEGIGVMQRNYKGTAPGGLTWDKLANMAGGKQHHGVTGVSAVYLRSRKFLQGDGGFAAVRWVSPKAFEIMKDLLPGAAEVGEEIT